VSQPKAVQRVLGQPPEPTPRFRHVAWRAYQRALDPLSPPKPLPPRRST
jgi:hypothetical protein